MNFMSSLKVEKLIQEITYSNIWLEVYEIA